GDGMSIGPVHFFLPAPSRIWHPQDPTEQLLDVLVTLDLSYRTEHVGEGAVPALFERLFGDDDFDGAIARKKIHAINLAGGPGGNCDSLLGNPGRYQMFFYFFNRGHSVCILSLYQQ